MLGVALFNARHHLFATACFTYVALVIAALLSHTACLQFFPRFSGFFFLLALITRRVTCPQPLAKDEYR
jgi:hypothetical protein